VLRKFSSFVSGFSRSTKPSSAWGNIRNNPSKVRSSTSSSSITFPQSRGPRGA
jgi:hypothetical protein